MGRPLSSLLCRRVSTPSLATLFNGLQLSQRLKWPLIGILGIGIAVVFSHRTLAQPSTSIEELLTEPKVMIDTLWVLIAAILVFFMNAGFAMLESGVCRRKNAVNVLTLVKFY
ncbi:MAG: ammonium transporter [Merismopedia sp. SIO2A8]|nr:ammonium transporter [Merismopedia sp. SIO2A8]